MFLRNNLQGKTYSIKNAQAQYQLQLYYLKFTTHKSGVSNPSGPICFQIDTPSPAIGLHAYWPKPEQKDNQYWRYSISNIVVVLVNIHMN